MKILAIDTATEACSAALYLNGQIVERFIEQHKGHGSLLLGMMDELLKETGTSLNDLDALTFGCGPGAFTGVRIATSVAQAVGFGANLPLVPVSNLALLAQGLYRKQHLLSIISVLDARMGEIYVGAYKIIDGIASAVMPEQLTRPDRFLFELDGQWHGVGRGWATHSTVLTPCLKKQITSITTNQLCRAQDLFPFAITSIKTGQVVQPELAMPVYLRDQVAWNSPKTT